MHNLPGDFEVTSMRSGEIFFELLHLNSFFLSFRNKGFIPSNYVTEKNRIEANS